MITLNKTGAMLTDSHFLIPLSSSASVWRSSSRCIEPTIGLAEFDAIAKFEMKGIAQEA